MKTVVCVKQVPETSDLKIDPETGNLIRSGADAIINPFDEYAIEEAIRIKEEMIKKTIEEAAKKTVETKEEASEEVIEKTIEEETKKAIKEVIKEMVEKADKTEEKYYGGEVIAISMGPPGAVKILKRALAMGANEAYLISDRSFAGADTLATSYILTKVIEMIGDVDLVFAGKQAIDGDTSQVPPGIAWRLGFSPLTYVSKIREIDLENKMVVAERLLEEGTEVVQTFLPAVITVMKGINEPRIPSIKGIMRTSKIEIPVLGPKDILDLDESKIGSKGSATKVKKTFSPQVKNKGGEIFTGETAVSDLVDRLMKSGVIK